MAFDFGKAGKAIGAAFDTDFVDIRRNVKGALKEIYSNVPCHVAFVSADNPDPKTVDVKPVIQSLTVHCGTWVDIQNDDFIVVKKMGSGGEVLKAYSGRCGNPVMSQGRQKVSVAMNATESEEPTPAPPKKSATVSVSYLCDGESVQDTAEFKAEVGSRFEMAAPKVEGYEPVGCSVDGEERTGTLAEISEVSEGGHEVEFLYEAKDTADYLRFLENGLYTKDDGSLAFGWHLFKKIPVVSVSEEQDGILRVKCEDLKFSHPETGGVFAVRPGERIVLMPAYEFARIEEVEEREDGYVTFVATAFEPTEEERNAYIAGWYDD